MVKPWISIGGLFLDLIGAIVLGSTLIISRKKIDDISTLRYEGQNLSLKTQLRRHHILGWIGVSLMVLGFSAQIVGQWPMKP
jgi:hypothetical protein